jgi:hypothetical protein
MTMHKMGPEGWPVCDADSWDVARHWGNVTCTDCLASRPTDEHER